MRRVSWSVWTGEVPRVVSTCSLVLLLAVFAGPVKGAEPGGEVALSVEAGEVRDFVLRLEEDDLPELRAEIGQLGDLPDGVRVGFAAPGSPQPERWPDEPLEAIARMPVGGSLYLRVMVRRCTGEGIYRLLLQLSTATYTAESRAELPIAIEVRPGNPCGRIYAETAIAAGAPPLVALILFCGWRLGKQSLFLRPAALARKIRPLSNDGTVPNDPGAEAARSQILHGLIRQRRVSIWVRTWWRWLRRRPSVVFCGGEKYRERVRVELGRGYDKVALAPVPEHELEASGSGALYAVATEGGGVRFVVVPGRDGRVGGMEMIPAPVDHGRELHLSRRTDFRYASPGESPAGLAGWRIG